MMRRVFQLPFPGFEGTWIEALIDDALDEIAVRHQEADGPDDFDEARDAVFDACDFHSAMDALSRRYCSEANRAIASTIGEDLDLVFDVVDHPNDYTFRNDRIFASITPARANAMFAASAQEGHSTLQRIIASECADGPGYVSFYSPDLDEWLEKPFDEWDEVELTLCVRAALQIRGLGWIALDDLVEVAMSAPGVVEPTVRAAIDWD